MDALEKLKGRVPPPANPVHVGPIEDWITARTTLGQELPEDLMRLSRCYGSGYFVQDDFWVDIHNVFTPRFVLLAQYNRMVFGSLARETPDPYANMFELGAYGVDDDQETMGRIFWDTRGAPNHWKIGLSRPPRRFELTLTEFLWNAFSNHFQIPGFPETFKNVRFEPSSTE